MIRPSFVFHAPSLFAHSFSDTYPVLRAAILCSLMLLPVGSVLGQVITIDTHSGNVTTGEGTVDRRYAQIKPTTVELPKTGLDENAPGTDSDSPVRKRLRDASLAAWTQRPDAGGKWQLEASRGRVP